MSSMLMLNRKSSGFTIVELLIVVVVIAILSSVSLVAYAGIQNRAYDAAIQSDIENLVKKIRIYEAENGSLPVAGSKSVSNAEKFPGITFSPAKSAYDKTGQNLFYCSGMKSGKFTFAIVANSKSKTMFIYRPEDGITTKVTVLTYAYGNCKEDFDAGTDGYSYGYYSNEDKWWDWTNG